MGFVTCHYRFRAVAGSCCAPLVRLTSRAQETAPPTPGQRAPPLAKIAIICFERRDGEDASSLRGRIARLLDFAPSRLPIIALQALASTRECDSSQKRPAGAPNQKSASSPRAVSKNAPTAFNGPLTSILSYRGMTGRTLAPSAGTLPGYAILRRHETRIAPQAAVFNARRFSVVGQFEFPLLTLS
jgi:hypothetical protein